MNNLIDDQELQRLLDGTLPGEDRVLLLQYADDNPCNWRRISMAFIEEQILKDELNRLVDLELFPSERVVRTAETSRVSSRGWTRLLSQAAVLCVILGAAVWMGRMSVDSQNKQIIGNNVAGADAAGDYTIVLNPELPPTELSYDRLANVEPKNNQDPVEQMLTPLFDQQSQGIFRDHGYTVNEEFVIYVVHGQQGEQYVVPRRNVAFVAQRE